MLRPVGAFCGRPVCFLIPQEHPAGHLQYEPIFRTRQSSVLFSIKSSGTTVVIVILLTLMRGQWLARLQPQMSVPSPVRRAGRSPGNTRVSAVKRRAFCCLAHESFAGSGRKFFRIAASFRVSYHCRPARRKTRAPNECAAPYQVANSATAPARASPADKMR